MPKTTSRADIAQQSHAARTPDDVFRHSTSELARWSRTPVVDSAAGLAFSREHPLDNRPEILLWHYAGDDSQAPLVAAFIGIRLVAFCAQERIAPQQDALNQATRDAMMLVRFCKADAADVTAAKIGMKASTYRALRNHALRVLIDALRSGRERFEVALGMRTEVTPLRPYIGPKRKIRKSERPMHPAILVCERQLAAIESSLENDPALTPADRCDLVIAGAGIMFRMLVLQGGTAEQIAHVEKLAEAA